MKRNVVITGIGILVPGGESKEEYWDLLMDKRSSINYITKFDTGKFPIKIAAEIRDFNPEEHLQRKVIQQTDISTQYAMVAAEAAAKNAGLNWEELDLTRVGIIMGNNLGGSSFSEKELQNFYQKGHHHVGPYQAIAWFYAATIGQIAIHYGIKGTIRTLVPETSAGLASIGQGYQMIQDGKADVILAGGCESTLSPYGFLCSISKQTYSEKIGDPSQIYRPFNIDRTGSVLGEGAVVLILEEESHAKKHNAHIYAEIAGYGATSSPDPTLFDWSTRGDQPDKSGTDGLKRAIMMALNEANIEAKDVDFVMANGEGTRQGDLIEATSLRQTVGEYVPVLSVKANTGHLNGANGAIEVATALMVFENGVIPPMINLENLDPECKLNFVEDPLLCKNLKSILINSTSWGGQNYSLLLKKNGK
jgi:3-oxoacyl-[acyl-carrier-protein] synthase II